MKLFLILLSVTFASLSHGVIETAYEVPNIKAEYYETTKTGKIFVYNCEHCELPFYSFKNIPIIIKNDQEISFKAFMQDPNKGGFTTLIVNIRDDSVLRIRY